MRVLCTRFSTRFFVLFFHSIRHNIVPVLFLFRSAHNRIYVCVFKAVRGGLWLASTGLICVRILLLFPTYHASRVRPNLVRLSLVFGLKIVSCLLVNRLALLFIIKRIT